METENINPMQSQLITNRRDTSTSGEQRRIDQHPVSKEYAAKLAAWERQGAALNAQKYRITLKPRREKDSNGRKLFDQNYGNSRRKCDRAAAGVAERFWTIDEVRAEIATLRTKNAQGYDIYITPIDESMHFIVVDDMTHDKEKALLGAGIQPAIIQKSSFNNKQAIIIIGREQSLDEQKMANQLVMQLNKKFGDENFSGVIHPFRMAGFSNKKSGKNDYLTTLEISVHCQCKIITAAMQKIRDDNRLTQAKVVKLKKEPSQGKETDKENDRLLQKIDELVRDDAVELVYRREVKKYNNLAKKQGWELDLSRVDFAVTKKMLIAGYRSEQIEKAIIAASPGLAGRHRDAARYAGVTVRNAKSSQACFRPTAKRDKKGRGTK